MKIRISILCFYWLLIGSIPTLQLAKMAMGCDSKSCKEQQKQTPSGCQKEKCLLSLNFNTGQFITQEVQEIAFNGEISTLKKGKSNYDKNFIPNYINVIWHPPKASSFVT